MDCFISIAKSIIEAITIDRVKDFLSKVTTLNLTLSLLCIAAIVVWVYRMWFAWTMKGRWDIYAKGSWEHSNKAIENIEVRGFVIVTTSKFRRLITHGDLNLTFKSDSVRFSFFGDLNSKKDEPIPMPIKVPGKNHHFSVGPYLIHDHEDLTNYTEYRLPSKQKTQVV